MINPLVSVITPSYNQAQWLDQTIQSVLCQTYPNVEYIIIDGGSKDGSKEIIEKYSPHLSYWQCQKDDGQADAINIGFGKAKGEILAYLNADDLLEPNAIESIVNAYAINPEFAVYYGKCRTIDEHGNLLEEGKGNPIQFDELVINGMLPNIYQPACFFNKIYCNRELILDTRYQFAFDYELILSLASKKHMMFLNSNIASYRVHIQSKSHLNKVAAYKEKLTIQENYSRKNIFLFKWRRLKLVLAQKTGKI